MEHDNMTYIVTGVWDHILFRDPYNMTYFVTGPKEHNRPCYMNRDNKTNPSKWNMMTCLKPCDRDHAHGALQSVEDGGVAGA